MDFTLDPSHEKYIKITISGLIVKSQLITVMSEILHHPQFLEKHTYWDLTQGSMGLSIGDLKEIIGVLRLYKPEKKNFADRSSLLVPGKMNKAIAEMFVTMAKVLPFKYRVFNDPEKAEAYLIS
ncbi:hypothetical protein [Desulfospira joergensenii]|uniref:hypothetical protein n=1 Tax=Desulfospira joergensenii TaxID=53329 RepID=UPI0003B55DEB|nr:hypothetical protein [Desulfospira joergensenii]